MVRIEIEGMGDIVAELYPGKAPGTCENFLKLAGSGFYDGLIFHRAIEDFMIQGGCPEGTGTGDPGYSIKGEFAKNGWPANDISHERGVVSMARSSDPDSAGSQFFICHKAAPHLDGSYAAFGKVVEGMEIVDRIASAKTGRNDRPLQPPVIASISAYGG
ncbi:MAG: peptidylprolyl isomerase [Clostridiales bacterium]|nr:peptidylprolyl isomerase [Clostridiales bacterium]